MTFVTLAAAKDERLRQLATSNPVANAVCRVLAARKQVRDTTDLSRLSMELKENGLDVALVDLVEVFRELQRLGYGHLEKKRKPTDHNRFHWSGKLNSKQVGIAAVGSHSLDSVPALLKPQPKDAHTKAWELSFPWGGSVQLLRFTDDVKSADIDNLVQQLHLFRRFANK